MYLNSTNYRKSQGYATLKDDNCGLQMVTIINKGTYKIVIVKSKIKNIIIIGFLGAYVLFGEVRKADAIGIPPPIVRVQKPHVQKVHQKPKIVPKIEERIFKIQLVASNPNLPIVLMHLKHNHINEKILKKISGGDLSATVGLLVIGIVLYLMTQTGSFQIVLNHNAPVPNMEGGPSNPQVLSASSSPAENQSVRSKQLQIYGPTQTQAGTFIHADGSVNLDLGYREVLRRGRFSDDFTCSFDRFVNLASESGETTTDSMRAAISALQLEADGIVSNVRRDPAAIESGVKGFDFLADGPNGTTHLEVKGPVGSKIREASGLRPSVAKQGKKVGYKIKNQLNYWFNPETDKTGITEVKDRDKVLVVADLFDVPIHEKSQMKSAIEHGLKNEHPVIYMNNVLNR